MQERDFTRKLELPNGGWIKGGWLSGGVVIPDGLPPGTIVCQNFAGSLGHNLLKLLNPRWSLLDEIAYTLPYCYRVPGDYTVRGETSGQSFGSSDTADIDQLLSRLRKAGLDTPYSPYAEEGLLQMYDALKRLRDLSEIGKLIENANQNDFTVGNTEGSRRALEELRAAPEALQEDRIREFFARCEEAQREGKELSKVDFGMVVSWLSHLTFAGDRDVSRSDEVNTALDILRAYYVSKLGLQPQADRETVLSAAIKQRYVENRSPGDTELNGIVLLSLHTVPWYEDVGPEIENVDFSKVIDLGVGQDPPLSS